MYEILEVLHDQKMVLATGHVSAEEIKILVRAVKKHDYNVPVLINHILFFSPALLEEDIEVLKNDKIWFEASHLTQKIQAAPIERLAKNIRKHADAQWVIVSDSGQKGNTAPQALNNFRDLLLQQGIKRPLLDKMMTISPRKLLYR